MKYEVIILNSNSNLRYNELKLKNIHYTLRNINGSIQIHFFSNDVYLVNSILHSNFEVFVNAFKSNGKKFYKLRWKRRLNLETKIA